MQHNDDTKNIEDTIYLPYNILIQGLRNADDNISEMYQKGDIINCGEALESLDGYVAHILQDIDASIDVADKKIARKEASQNSEFGMILPYQSKDLKTYVDQAFLIPYISLEETFEFIADLDDKICDLEDKVEPLYDYLMSTETVNKVINFNWHNPFDPVSDMALGVGVFAIDYGHKYVCKSFQMHYFESEDKFYMSRGTPKTIFKNSDSKQLNDLYNSLNVIFLSPTPECSNSNSLFRIGETTYANVYDYLTRTGKTPYDF